MFLIFRPLNALWTVEVENEVLISDLDDVLSNHNPPLALPSNVALESVRHGGIISFGGVSSCPDRDSTTLGCNSQPRPAGVINTYILRIELDNYRLQTSDTFPLLRDALSVPEVHDPLLKKMFTTNDQIEIFYWSFNSSGSSSKNDSIWVKQWQRIELSPTVSPTKEWAHELWQKLETRFGDKLYDGGDRDEVLDVRNVIHYQKGIDNIPCMDMDMAFKCDDNFGNVVLAWNYVIDQLYEYAKRTEFPLNLTLEVRFVKSSSQLMSNAFDTDPDAIYCMIIKNTKSYEEFWAKIAQYWMKEFNAKPHWAKMWEHSPDIKPYLIKQAGNRFSSFEVVRRKYDPTGMFLNKTFAGLVGPK
ncbi:hypothetical protein CPB97_001069 [Podila verticillata]|nr:hypothetical protein CPB97_001069 [Podila verticillata]